MNIRVGEIRRHERGAALIIALLLLLLMTVLGVSAMRTSTLQERMAGNVRDSNLAFQAAEAGLRSGEAMLDAASIPPFTGSSGLLDVPKDAAGQAAYWNAFDWAGNSRVVTVTGVATSPQYVIEDMSSVGAASCSDCSVVLGQAYADTGFYRITARAVGGSTDAVAILQTTYFRQ